MVTRSLEDPGLGTIGVPPQAVADLCREDLGVVVRPTDHAVDLEEADDSGRVLDLQNQEISKEQLLRDRCGCRGRLEVEEAAGKKVDVSAEYVRHWNNEARPERDRKS